MSAPSASKVPDRFCHNIDELVQRWNDWEQFIRRSHAENYANGDIEFLLPQIRFDGISRGLNAPTNVPAIVAKRRAVNVDPCGKVMDLSPQIAIVDFGVVANWNKQFVLVDQIKLMQEEQHFIPSTIRLEIVNPLSDLWQGLAYQSCRDNVVQSFGKLTERERGISCVRDINFAIREKRIPPGMIERPSEIVNCIAANQTQVVYDGFVLFGIRGAFMSLVVGFQDIDERARFAEQFVGFDDVFFGPLNLR